jgi:hypothetical protein
MPDHSEERLTLLEAEVDRLKRKIELNLTDLSWWEKIVGTFTENSAYDEAMKLGREYRESDRVLVGSIVMIDSQSVLLVDN